MAVLRLGRPTKPHAVDVMDRVRSLVRRDGDWSLNVSNGCTKHRISRLWLPFVDLLPTLHDLTGNVFAWLAASVFWRVDVDGYRTTQAF